MGLTVANYILQPFFPGDCRVPTLAAQLMAAALICTYADPDKIISRIATNFHSMFPRFPYVCQLLRYEINHQNAERVHVHQNRRSGAGDNIGSVLDGYGYV